MPESRLLTQTLLIYQADDFIVTDGVAEGDAISFADELVMDDVYQLGASAQRKRLSLSLGLANDGAADSFTVDDESEIGRSGNVLHLDCCLTLMAPDGATFEALILVEVEDSAVAAIYLLPLATLIPRTDYRLVGADRDAASTRFAEVACVSFTRGTLITMASGQQMPIERLKVGDKVLTRDDGPQAIRWVGHTTLRAVGAFAPVMIRKGALHNENDLIVSPDHRIFIYQRQDSLGTGRAEVLVKVRHLINGDTVIQLDGGFVEYFQLLFDDHQIIYAEGIAAESLLIDPRTRPAVPHQLGATRHSYRPHLGYEVQENMLSGPDAVTRLRRASGAD